MSCLNYIQIVFCTCYARFAHFLRVRRWWYLTLCRVNNSTILFVSMLHVSITWHECPCSMSLIANKWRYNFSVLMLNIINNNIFNRKLICEVRRLPKRIHVTTMNLIKIVRLLLKMFVQRIILHKMQYTHRLFNKS